MAGNGDQRAVEIVGHRLDEAGLAATRGPLQDKRQALPVGRQRHGPAGFTDQMPEECEFPDG